MTKIGILSSYNGSGFDALYEAIQTEVLKAEITVVISNNSNANVLKNAQARNIPNFLVNTKKYPNENIDEKITELLLKHKCDFVFLSGFMKKIEKNLLAAYPNKIINSHPALLPNFGGRGMYGRFVHEAVFKSHATKSGATIHYVNENYDEGSFVIQKELNIEKNESVDSIESRVKALETIAIVEAFVKLVK